MRKRPKYKQGVFKPKNLHKYNGDVDKIIYRSGLELKFFNFLDNNKNILKWSSEEVVVPYISLDGKIHRYFLDIWAKVKTKNGAIKEFIGEIKPEVFTKAPKKPKRMTRQWKEKYKTYLINQAKWDSAKKFAEKKGWKFELLTENDIL